MQLEFFPQRLTLSFPSLWVSTKFPSHGQSTPATISLLFSPTKKICPFLFNIEACISNLLDQQNKFLTKLFFPILQPYKGFNINNFITLFIFRAPNPPFSLQKKEIDFQWTRAHIPWNSSADRAYGWFGSPFSFRYWSEWNRKHPVLII